MIYQSEFYYSYLLDTFLGVKPTINESTVCTYPKPWYNSTQSTRNPIVTTHQASRPLTEYVGVYHHIAYGDLEVRLNTTVNQLQVSIIL